MATTSTDPYDVLGVPPSSTLREIESRYHELLLEHHPDLHGQAGSEVVAEAERTTQQLNQAMAMLRSRHPAEGFETAAFICPLCRSMADSFWLFERHCSTVHGIRLDAQPSTLSARTAPKPVPYSTRVVAFVVAMILTIVFVRWAGSTVRVYGAGQYFVGLGFAAWTMVLGWLLLANRR